MPVVTYETQIERRLAGEPLTVTAYEQRTRLYNTAAVGATSIVVDGWPGAAVGCVVVIDAYTVQAEARQVTAITGTATRTLSFTGGLAYAHAYDDRVLVVTDSELSVLWFGAVADGVTDDLLSFQRTMAAITALGGGVVRVPGLTYALRCDTTNYIVVPSNCRIDMSGAQINVTVTAAQTGYYLFAIGAKTNVELCGGVITLDRASASLSGETGQGVRISNGATDITIRDMTINDSWGDAVYIGGSSAPARVRLVRLTVDNCRRNGISLVYGTDILIDACACNNTNGTSPQSGIDIEPNASTTIRSVVVRNCVFRANTNCGLIVQAGAGGRTAGIAATSHVRVEGCTAIDNGAGINLSVVDEVTVSGCLIDGATVGIGLAGSELLDCALEGNTIRDCTTYGIYVEGAQHCRVANNSIQNSGAVQMYLRGQPATAGDLLALEHCTIADNNIYDGARGGGYIANAWGCTITGNVSAANARTGFVFASCNHNEISDNVTTGDGGETNNTYYGLELQASSYNVIRSNIVRHSERYAGGTASAGSAATITLPATGQVVLLDDWYNGKEIALTAGTGSGQTRTISDYDGITRIATVSLAWTTPPDNTSVFELRNANRLANALVLNASANYNWYVGNDFRLGGSVADSGAGNVTTAGNLT